MKQPDEEPMVNLQEHIERACLKQCIAEGPAYTRNVASELAKAVDGCRDPRKRDALISLLAKVEALEEPVLFERERAP